MSTQRPTHEAAAQMPRQKYAVPKHVPKLVTSKEQILHEYPDVFEGIGSFPGHPYQIQIGPSVTPKQTPCCPIPVHLKEVFKQEEIRCYKQECLNQYMRLHPGLIILCL